MSKSDLNKSLRFFFYVPHKDWRNELLWNVAGVYENGFIQTIHHCNHLLLDSVNAASGNFKVKSLTQLTATAASQ